MRKREHEFRVKLDEMSAKVLEYELKVSVDNWCRNNKHALACINIQSRKIN